MARDYKHRAQPRSRRPPVSGWAWFFSGLLIGVISTGVLWWKISSLEEGESWIGARPEEPPRPATTGAAKPPRPKFDFYTLLPEMEVIVPDDELDSVAPEAASPPPSPPRRRRVNRVRDATLFRSPRSASRPMPRR